MKLYPPDQPVSDDRLARNDCLINWVNEIGWVNMIKQDRLGPHARLMDWKPQNQAGSTGSIGEHDRVDTQNRMSQHDQLESSDPQETAESGWINWNHGSLSEQDWMEQPDRLGSNGIKLIKRIDRPNWQVENHRIRLDHWGTWPGG